MTLVLVPATNHDTRTGSESVSHRLAAAATILVPAIAPPDATTPSGTTARPDPSPRRGVRPTLTRATGPTKCTVTLVPRFGRSKVVRIRAEGVASLTVRVS
jgi:hypothetical protein